MLQTSKLKLPLIESSQAQKHIVHNEAIKILSILVQARAIEVLQNTPPNKPQMGETYVVGETPSGSWANKKNTIAVFQNSTWLYIEPDDGIRIWDMKKNNEFIYINKKWSKVSEYQK